MGADMQRAAPARFCPGEPLGRAREAPDTMQLQWYRAAEDRDRDLSTKWCATVGSPAIRLSPTADFPAWSQALDLEVVTWNMHIGGGDLYRMLDVELGLDCSAARPALRRGASPFVVLLQEVWRRSEDLPEVESSSIVPWTIDPDRATGEDPDIREAAERCGLAYLYVPSARNGPDSGARPGEDKGNAILSTVPLSTPIAMDLPLEGGRKVAIAATILAPGGERVRVTSVHLDVASTLVRTLLSGNQTRARQVSGLIDAVDRADGDGPLTAINLVGGDFNTWVGNESTLKLMRQAFPESPEWDGLGTRGGFPTDHFFFRRGSFVNVSLGGYHRIDDSYGSDHQGRRLTLSYSSSGER
jgi:endonuclease/exonuclease/phosphatase family metal-dependent hydrolase